MSIKTLLIIFLTVVLGSAIAVTTVAVEQNADNFTVYFDLDFFNRFTNDVSSMETFQRYHMITLDLTQGRWRIQGIYDWFDQVDSEVSTHNVTPWAILLQYSFNENQTLTLDYLQVMDLRTLDSTYTIKIGYFHSFLLNDKWNLTAKINTGLDNQDDFIFTPGGKLSYLDSYYLSINYLDPIDSRILDENDSVSNIPLNIGAVFHIRDYWSLRTELFYFLISQPSEPNLWLKIGLRFRL